MQVSTYLRVYRRHPKLIEHLVKVGFERIVSDIVYRHGMGAEIDATQKRTHRILRVNKEDLAMLRELNAGVDVRLNIMALGAWNPSYEGKIHLLKPIKAQGTLENKIILAQFVAIFQTMEYFKTSATRFSFVVDSPRAKEASASSSKDILKMIAQMKMLPQVILATINYSEYKPEIEIPANIITLSEKGKLLREDDYTKKRDMIRGIHELLK